MALQIIESLLEDRIGLAADSIGLETIRRAVYRRMDACGIADEQQYAIQLRYSEKELEALVEEVVIPETWFFRNKASFAFLGRYVLNEWLPKRKTSFTLLRILSLPCATGEEPCSIAITLLDSGLPPDSFQIDAVDISQRALIKARTGIFYKESFRGRELSFRKRWFSPIDDGYQIHPSVLKTIRFVRGNILDENLLIDESPYDIVFCRNLLIYLSESAKRKGLETVNRLLRDKGVLFVGHVERPRETQYGFKWIRQPGVFACRKYAGGPADEMKSRPANHQKRSVHCSKFLPFRDLPQSPLQNKNAKFEKNKKPYGPKPDKSPAVSTSVANSETTLLQKVQDLADRGKLKDALILCKQVLNGNSFHIQAHFLMGLICQALDDELQAEAAFNKVAYLDPNHYEALNHLAFILEHRGEKEQALRVRQRIQRILQRVELDSGDFHGRA